MMLDKAHFVQNLLGLCLCAKSFDYKLRGSVYVETMTSEQSDGLIAVPSKLQFNVESLERYLRTHLRNFFKTTATGSRGISIQFFQYE